MAGRYHAFISYSHADETWARWLQRALERYRVPKRLRQRENADLLPARLYPVFRDRDELASADDLSEAILRALAESGALIVVCSPAAAASRWVNEEIRYFQARGLSHRVFCLLVAGSPDPSASDCAFPPALLHNEDGSPRHEPLAADVFSDGKHNALLKIAAGLLCVGVDDLKRRDAQRRAWIRSMLTTGLLVISTVTVSLAIVAYLSRQESEVRRGQAEHLINFMLGDLRSKLEPLGKLDLLDAVGDQAESYFDALGDRGTAAEVLARAIALRQIGEVRFSQGRLKPALAAFRKSLAQAQALHTREPENNDYLFELGQAEFWVGYVAWQRNDLDFADNALERYMQRSRELLAREPKNAGYKRELAYAYSNLGSVARERGMAADALSHFNDSQAVLRQLLVDSPNDDALIFDLSEGLSWIGSTLLDLGRIAESEQAFRETYSLLAKLHATGENPRYSNRYGVAGTFLALVLTHQGNVAEAKALLDESTRVCQALVDHDPSNAEWRYSLYNSQRAQAELARATGEFGLADRLLTRAHTGFSQLTSEDPSNRDYARALAMVERLQALRVLDIGHPELAMSPAISAMARADAAMDEKGRDSAKLDTAQIAETLGRIQHAAGQTALAEASWSKARELLKNGAQTGVMNMLLRAELAQDSGDTDQALELADALRNAGFNDPRYPLPTRKQ
ncbi:MAG: toll/interleukin-1 receptor domain-containing protein [Xanthomonadaceae bacterium]|nr:toll/interleukin-1 receptor domain-containing protein [Xanthomonadaceae bacterium]MDP2185478.1 toll/interleukin-1 receptor domain-containing protein [Xanthomonadales bacterium]MDZ4116718.1 toll/interleukin-1 receptor domain-containing protein [Xanthomonadaceae bacterium]MDZ4379237.1 toll/interleukin-1 receptor domain-containing protein [Xanthomonadaceae bacterium]